MKRNTVVSILRVLVATLQLYETTIVTNIHNVYKKVNHYGIKFYIYEIYEFLLGGCILILMIYFRLFTDVDSVYYVSFIMPSAISVIFYKENMRTILFILIALLLYFAFIWIDFSFSNILYSIVGFFIAVVNIFILRKVKVNK